mmetsp:Transcript_7634/g.24500  ORF Transcript_7634/g.24500 Transcript_7634/m.24500 type:complete len:293 (+) Transcript_7634:826-1704(+)
MGPRQAHGHRRRPDARQRAERRAAGGQPAAPRRHAEGGPRPPPHHRLSPRAPLLARRRRERRGRPGPTTGMAVAPPRRRRRGRVRGPALLRLGRAAPGRARPPPAAARPAAGRGVERWGACGARRVARGGGAARRGSGGGERQGARGRPACEHRRRDGARREPGRGDGHAPPLAAPRGLRARLRALVQPGTVRHQWHRTRSGRGGRRGERRGRERRRAAESGRRRDRRRLRRLARQESHAGGHARADFLLGRTARQRRRGRRVDVRTRGVLRRPPRAKGVAARRERSARRRA